MKFKSKLKQYAKEFLHNVIVHPLMMVMPCGIATKMHDRNANWAFKERIDELYYEGYKDKDECQ